MASVNIYNQDEDKTYTVSFDLKNTFLKDVVDGDQIDYYLSVSTSMKKIDGTAFPRYVVKNLGDLPPGYAGAANSFSDLCQKYITYFMDTSELIVSSSSSSSEGYTSSSSSSSAGISSSSSSEGNSSSSSSTSESSSSSSSTSESSSSSSSTSESSSSSSESGSWSSDY